MSDPQSESHPTDGLDAVMQNMPEKWRTRWCEPGELGCACRGCANGSGGLLRRGYTKDQWDQWMESNGENQPR